MKTLVVGLGNPSFKDDSIGPRITRLLADRINRPDITVAETSASGLDFLDLLAEYDKAVIIDAIQSLSGKAGSTYRLKPETLNSRHKQIPHTMDFVAAIDLGKRLGLPLPGEIIIIGIEVGDITNPGNHCTPQVENAIPSCVEQVLREIN